MANKYKVTYSYEGSTPADAPALPEQKEYEVGATVPHAAVPSLVGSVFHGWIGEVEVMPPRDVNVTGHWVAEYLRDIFNPKFNEFVTLYRGVERIWISDEGVCYAEMENGAIQTLGPVTSYYYALEHGFVGTFEEWEEVIRNGTDNALLSEGYARGTHNNTPVASTDPEYKNNSKFYAGSAESWAEGTRESVADTERLDASTHNAKYWSEERAKKWAVKSTNTGSPSDTNNAEYYAEQSANSASASSNSASEAAASESNANTYKNDAYTAKTGAEAAQTAAETAQQLAETAQAASETAQHLSETAQANAETAQGLAETAQSLSETAQANAETAQENAETAQAAAETAQAASEAAQIAAEAAQHLAETAQTASETAQGLSETAQAAAETAQANAETAEENSEAWATGKRNGVDVPSSDETYHNNSKYYSELAASSEANASTYEANALSYKNSAEAAQAAAETAQTNAELAQTAAETAQTTAETAQTNAETAQGLAEDAQAAAELAQETAEKWATNSTGGNPSATNNAKYYAEQAADSAANANTSASNAALSGTNAEQWATGGSGGTASATNNAKYYAEQAALSATSADNSASDADTAKTDAQTAKTGAQAAQASAETAEAGAISAKDVAAQWATGNTTGTPSSTNNAKYYSEQSADSATTSNTYATNAQNSSYDAEAWAVGQRNGSDVGSADNTYHNNSKYYAAQARSTADEIESVTPVTVYQTSTSGTEIPAGTWTDTPTPVTGRYLWSKSTLTWGNATTSVIYSVGYIGADGVGAVNSVNAQSGDVVLHGSDIELTEQDSTKVSAAINSKAPIDSPSFINGITVTSGTVTIGDATLSTAQLKKILALINTIEITE